VLRCGRPAPLPPVAPEPPPRRPESVVRAARLGASRRLRPPGRSHVPARSRAGAGGRSRPRPSGRAARLRIPPCGRHAVRGGPRSLLRASQVARPLGQARTLLLDRRAPSRLRGPPRFARPGRGHDFRRAARPPTRARLRQPPTWFPVPSPVRSDEPPSAVDAVRRARRQTVCSRRPAAASRERPRRRLLPECGGGAGCSVSARRSSAERPATRRS